MQIEKEVKLFAVDMMAHLGNLRESKIKLTETIVEFSKGAGYKMFC